MRWQTFLISIVGSPFIPLQCVSRWVHIRMWSYGCFLRFQVYCNLEIKPLFEICAGSVLYTTFSVHLSAFAYLFLHIACWRSYIRFNAYSMQSNFLLFFWSLAEIGSMYKNGHFSRMHCIQVYWYTCLSRHDLHLQNNKFELHLNLMIKSCFRKGGFIPVNSYIVKHNFCTFMMLEVSKNVNHLIQVTSPWVHSASW
jgi:hypothetical protein